MEELKPCPFCGGEAEYERLGTAKVSCIVSCTECGCRHQSSDSDWTNGSSWNRRINIENKIIFKRDYHGFEDAVDLERDISECFDSRFNPEAKDIPNEFTGTVKVTIEYVPSEEN